MFPKSLSENKTIHQAPDAKMITDSFKPVYYHSDEDLIKIHNEFKEYKLSQEKTQFKK